MLKNVLIALSISLFAVACGGGAEEAKSADEAKKDAPAADAKPADGAPAGDAKPAEGAAPAGDAKPAEGAPK